VRTLKYGGFLGPRRPTVRRERDGPSYSFRGGKNLMEGRKKPYFEPAAVKYGAGGKKM